jgi:hypothetical protein
VHVSAARRAGYASLVEGQRLEFTIGVGGRSNRPCADRIRLVEPIICPPRETYPRHDGPEAERDDDRESPPIGDVPFMQ